VLLCLPTAPALPVEEPGTSVRLRFWGSSRTSNCSPVFVIWGVDRKEQWRVEEIRADPSRRWCGCTQKVFITLAEKGTAYDTQNVDLFKNEQFKPEYLKINPKASCRRSIMTAGLSSNPRLSANIWTIRFLIRR
jgi:hypothetical protein